MNYLKIYIKKYFFKIFILGCLALTEGVVSFFIPISTKVILNSFQERNYSNLIISLFIFSTVSLFVVRLFKSYITQKYALKVKEQESLYLFHNLLKVKIRSFEQKGPTYLSGRVQQSIGHISNFTLNTIPAVFVSLASIIISLFLAYKLNIYIGILFTLLIPINVLGYNNFNKAILERTKDLQENVNKSSQFVLSIIRGISTIKQIFNYEFTSKKLRDYVNINYISHYNINWFCTRISLALDLVCNIIKNSILLISIYLFAKSEMKIGDLVFISMVFSLYFSALQQLVNLNISTRDIKISCKFIADSILNDTEDDAGEVSLNKFKNISIGVNGFCYGDEGKQILKNIKFHIEKGDKVAIVGRSGSGKSTLLNIINRLYDPSRVFINGTSYTSYSLESFRKKIYMIYQESLILPGTIKENIFWGISSDNNLEKLAELRIYNDFIEDFPDGIDTIMLEGGSNLSGGQRQKLALLRVFANDPDVLILDEATSALDEKSEEIFFDDLNIVFPKITVMLVSHRSSTVKRCNRIIDISCDNISKTHASKEYKPCEHFA